MGHHTLLLTPQRATELRVPRPERPSCLFTDEEMDLMWVGDRFKTRRLFTAKVGC